MPTVAGPWRRFLRISVRGMIVVVLLVGGWLGWIVRSARIQREAVAAINKQGGHAIYDGWHWDNDRLTNGKPWPPKWLANAIGVHYFANVTDVMIVDPFDDTLSHVGQLRQVRTLDMMKARIVTNAGLAHLKDLTKLTELRLFNSRRSLMQEWFT